VRQEEEPRRLRSWEEEEWEEGKPVRERGREGG
jgi:hypothetical protein